MFLAGEWRAGSGDVLTEIRLSDHGDVDFAYRGAGGAAGCSMSWPGKQSKLLAHHGDTGRSEPP
ncbi:hypothetical protein [Amycolatopsis thermoflava]|uniref:hypothetical protein n=1 Tax=Amycolatopsis thermoflava TaxID=84480 RepID=UPI0036647E78